MHNQFFTNISSILNQFKTIDTKYYLHKIQIIHNSSGQVNFYKYKQYAISIHKIDTKYDLTSIKFTLFNTNLLKPPT